jgi:Kef-type K+ transport system membrane component KefB
VNARDTLVARGASLLAAGLLARVGRRIGLPTIPRFMIAGRSSGRTRPGSNWSTLVLPLRDTFAPLFFFTFGLTVEPGDV